MTEHLPIQRWDYDDLCAGPLKFKGEVFVTYDDHVAALAEAEQRVLKDTATRHLALIKMIGLGILQTRADELRACEARVIAAAVQRVEDLEYDPDSGVDWNWDYEADPTGMTRNPRVWIREAVAAIKKGEQ